MNRHLRLTTSGYGATWVFAIAFAAVHYVVYTLFPRVDDDLWYTEKFLDYALHGIGDYPWRQMLDTTMDHFMGGDNVRLANIVLLPLLTIPRWVAALLPAAVTGAMLAGVARFASSVRYPTPLMLTASAMCISFMLPWHECFFTFCFSLNYVFPAAMMVWFLIALRRGSSGRSELPDNREAHGTSSWRWVAPVNALLLGAFNEALSLPVLGGVIVTLLLFREYRTRRVALLTGCLLIGVLYVVVSRYFILSAEQLEEEIHFGIIKIVKLQWPLALYVFALAVTACRRGIRSVLTPGNAALLTIAVTSVVINIFFERGERISTAAHMASLCGLLQVSGTYRYGRSLRITAIVASLVILAVHYAAVINLTAKVHREWDKIFGIIFAEGGPETNAIITELTLPDQESLWGWRKPTSAIDEGWDLTVVNRLVRRAGYIGPDVYFIPEELRHVTADSGTPVPGTAGVRRLGRWYFTPYREPWIRLPMTHIGPFYAPKQFLEFKFTSEADGRDYYFLRPQTAYFPSFLLPIHGIDLPPELILLHESQQTQAPADASAQ
ncbi:MAG: hypothetical protein NC187_02020 [Candidatus Amulumruptor caecigallinarius]|nr:hypothetical protein [Candidatus Amulumruptor caecigallinarius]MCM1396253.1 hypothetical protein [Candidatus Amulumruptor caecigallinarius]MCM1454305.1 hypothetical protein [bacterium]